jgi:cytoskeletal protein CcmA (bactofilin family)
MWKRDEAVRPPSGRETTTPTPATPSVPPPSTAVGSMPPTATRQMERDIVNIGKSVVIKGELSGSEDLTIEGHVEGKIELRENVLTIGPNGKIKAQIFAKAVIVLGEVTGNVSASEKVDIRDNGSVEGDIVSPRVAIAEGAMFRGSVDMQRTGKAAQTKPSAQAEPKGEGKTAVAANSPAAAAAPAQGSVLVPR